jgi:hypothetical protein
MPKAMTENPRAHHLSHFLKPIVISDVPTEHKNAKLVRAGFSAELRATA